MASKRTAFFVLILVYVLSFSSPVFSSEVSTPRKAIDDHLQVKAIESEFDRKQAQLDTEVRSRGGYVEIRKLEGWSGHGDAWSSWYSLSSPVPKRGFEVESVEFVLRGDRRCGAWAECERVRSSAAGETWRFRMQGHDEDLELEELSVTLDDGLKIKVKMKGRAATSTGILRTRYRPIQPPQPATTQ